MKLIGIEEHCPTPAVRDAWHAIARHPTRFHNLDVTAMAAFAHGNGSRPTRGTR